MMNVLVMALALAPLQVGDTTLSADGVRLLDVELHDARVEVTSWDRDEIEVTMNRPRDIEVERRGSTVSIEDRRRRGGNRVEIRVPRRINVNVEGIKVATRLAEIEGDVDIETIQGEIRVTDVTGDIMVESISGPIRLERCSGEVEASTAGSPIVLVDVIGEVMAETVGGSLEVHGETGPQMALESVGGHIWFAGSVDPEGDYYISSHGGPIDLEFAPGASIALMIETHSGPVDVNYPDVRLLERTQDEYWFEIGSGSARFHVETFSGPVEIDELGARQRRRR